MKFFFPDSLDVVDPFYDFKTESHPPNRIHQRDDIYPHELFPEAPYDGMLVSRAIVQGVGSAKYTIAQRQRFLRVGVREFLRLDNLSAGNQLMSMGDCGAFSYVNEERPPVSVEEVVDFYANAGFDYGASVDHVILAYRPELDQVLEGGDFVPPEFSDRQRITLELASKFLDEHGRRACSFVPLGVAQGWSPKSYASSVVSLQDIGYKQIALGGMVSLKTTQILDCLKEVQTVRDPTVTLHLFGVTRLEIVDKFPQYGVTSFDSTSPLRQAFKDDSDNYHLPGTTYSAIRVPQVDGNPKLLRAIKSGAVDQESAMRLESRCMLTLKSFDEGSASLDETLLALEDYSRLYEPNRDRSEVYRRVLVDRPWGQCDCAVCQAIGIDVLIFRGAERNRRRGFHNLWVLHQKLRNRLECK